MQFKEMYERHYKASHNQSQTTISFRFKSYWTLLGGGAEWLAAFAKGEWTVTRRSRRGDSFWPNEATFVFKCD